MKKYIFFSIFSVIGIVGILGGIKGLQIGRMIAHGKEFVPPPEIVTTAPVQPQTWESVLTSVGSLEAVQGMTVTSELSGKVARIAFQPGTRVKAGDLLLQQDITSEAAQLKSAEATLALAKINIARAAKLLPDRVISQSDYDNADAQYKQALAQMDTIRAVIAKKTIRAPFDGRLGLRQVNLGQVISAGQPIVSLQSLDPIFVNFLLPQQELERLRNGLDIRITTDALAGREIQGRITAVNPEVDAATRNIRIQATVANAEEYLRPGMYVNVELILPSPKQVLAVPGTAVLYAPYSDSRGPNRDKACVSSSSG
ncbi:MAG: efflux RND transporter periplasmic adaptor subunit [Desulfosarcinaceae bacterium]